MDKYDIDVRTLRKGDKIPGRVIEKETGIRRNSVDYWKGILAIKTFLLEEFSRHHSQVVTIRQVGDSLEILTDVQASKYNPRQFMSGIRRMHKSYVRNAGVDRSSLKDPELTREHDRNLIIEGCVLQAATASLKRAKLHLSAKDKKEWKVDHDDHPFDYIDD
jgi:hypothetical protein